MRLVAGLGNPGERYRRTRHNAGFMVIDVLAARAGAFGREDGDVWTARAAIAGLPVLLARPLSYMNGSGEPLARLLAENGLGPSELVVIVDDVALELGTVRVRPRGSDGGHNGLRSIGEALGTGDFARVRVGVRSGELPAELADYVLSPVPADEEPALERALALAADAVACLVAEGPAAAMNGFNGRRA